MIIPVQSIASISSPMASSSALTADPGQSFGKVLGDALKQVGDSSNQADALAASYAAGGPVSLDQLMIAEQQASLGVDMVVQVRDRIVSAYQSVMNMQV